MTVSSSVNRWSYAGNGEQTIFPYVDFMIYAASDLKVYLRNADGVEVLQVLDVDYSVDGVLDEGGGNVTFGTAPASGVTIVIKAELSYTQELALPEAGLLPTGPLEIALDRLVKLCLQLKEEMARALKFSVASPSQNMVCPEPEAGKYLVWGPDGALANTALLTLSDALTVIAEVEDYFSNPANFPAGQDAAKIADGSVSNAEFQYLNGLTAAIQGQINALTAALPKQAAILQNRQAQNTGGGTATAGSWGIVPFNVEYQDGDWIVDATALPAFSLAPGTYKITAFLLFAPAVQKAQCRLFNVTDNAVQQNINAHEMYSSSMGQPANDQFVLFLTGTILITAIKQFRIEYSVNQTVATTGHGIPANMGPEVYAQLMIDPIS